MALTHAAIKALAPDAAALTAAAGLLKPAKWPLRAQSSPLIWGECQGSGANPYRVAADIDDGGAKCTCPSRKFPCKHGLALLWMFTEDAAAFAQAAIPDWVTEWQGRRRKSSTPPPVTADAGPIIIAQTAPPDPEAEARRLALAQKRAADTRRSVHAATLDLDTWISDQLAALPAFLADPAKPCRKIAARLVDAKAAALASRLDELPSRLLALPGPERPDAAIAELGKLVLLVHAWRAAPRSPDLRRELLTAESRDDVLADPTAPRVASAWEVLGERIVTRRDGLVGVSTWLLNLRPSRHQFALLADYFPASAGRRAGAFAPGERFTAELAYYPAKSPFRAVIVTRAPGADAAAAWPAAAADPFQSHASHLLATPWALESPLLLPAGRIGRDARNRDWWQSGALSLPLEAPAPLAALGAVLSAAAGIWTGTRLALLAAQSAWGRLSFDG